MEQEFLIKQKQMTEIPNDFQILKLIETTYSSKISSQIANAETMLNNLLAVDKFIQKLFGFLENQDQVKIQNAQSFKISVSILIKKFSYQYAKKQSINKQMFVSKLFCIIISKINIKCKQQLGTALQYVLNHDLDYIYKPKVINKVQELLSTQVQNHILQGAIIISVSCLNSLIEVEDQFNFLWKMLDPLIKNAFKILEILKIQPVQNLHFQESKKLFKLSRKIFDFMELAFSRLLDQEDFIQEKISQLRQYQLLQNLFYSYLSQFGYRKSILSTIAEINSVKQLIVEIIFGLYRSKPMPQHIFNLFFITLLLESEKRQYQEEEEHIMTRILELLEDYLDNKFYMQTFDDHKMQVMISILGYAVTKPEEIDMIQDQPQRFVQLAQQFTQGFKGSVKIKVRAASFLKLFVHKFDQALRNILEIIVILITAHLQRDLADSPCIQLYNNIKEQFPDMGFFKLDATLHFETCFNILSLLSVYINKRQDLNKIVYALLITHMNSFQVITQPIILLRLIRLVGYYPTAVYYPFIKLKMSLGKVFVLEGLKAFQRILKLNRYPEIFQVLAQLFSQLANTISVHDSIFQCIILNHYQRVLKKNKTLYRSFLYKIRDTFIQNIQKSQHLSMLCLSYLYSMLTKQNQPQYRNQIINTFYSMEMFYNKCVDFYTQKINNYQNGNQLQDKSGHSNSLAAEKKSLKTLNNYEDKIVDLYSLIVKKQPQISQRVVQFSKKHLQDIGNQNQNAEIFKLYNNLFLKLGDTQDISIYLNSFMNQIRKMFSIFFQSHNQTNISQTSYTHKLQILPNLCYLVSQIFSCFYDIHLQKSDVIWIIRVMPSLTEDVKQYLLLILLTYTYLQPIKFREILLEQHQYENLLKVLLTTNYSEKLIRKIFLLAMAKLLEIEQQYFQDIVRECIKYFKEQQKQNQVKKTTKAHIDPKLRRYLQDEPQEQEQLMMMQQKKKQKNMTSFPQFKHPYSALSQYDQFKIRIWNNSQPIKRLSQNDKNDLRNILQMDWFGKGVRKIVQVKQQF